MVLQHFSAKPFRLNRSKIYLQRTDFKPEGFWVSDESKEGWKQWCQAEGFRVDTLKYCFEITLDPKKLLIIKTAKQLEKFNAEYGIERLIDWRRVSKEYQGVLITPYQWKFRHGFIWYYTWDCASGCIWDLRGIKKKRLVKNNEQSKRVRRSEKKTSVRTSQARVEFSHRRSQMLGTSRQKRKHGIS